MVGWYEVEGENGDNCTWKSIKKDTGNVKKSIKLKNLKRIEKEKSKLE